MKPLLTAVLFAAAGALIGAEPAFRLPEFPLPSLVKDEYGSAKKIGFLTFLRELREGGLSSFDDVDFVDDDYAVLESDSLRTLAAWLESASRCVGIDLQQARAGSYDGLEYARLLEVAASLASVRQHGPPLAMPIGVLVCKRRVAWGDLPGDGDRDAYVLIATERGLLVYDPPTRQLAELAKFPNGPDVFKIQF
jgi:hypothetical protein